MLTLLLIFAITPDTLAEHPAVASVRVAVDVDEPALTIIHIRDWHLANKNDFAVGTRR